ncbi:hypothetical protein MASR2M32_13550 [Sphaerotilus sulfidivorans]
MTRSASPSAAGIGLRAPHLAEVRARQPELGFLEVHSENFFAEGGAARAALLGLRADHAVSLHGVGLSLGSATGLDAEHLARLAALVAAVEPVRVSDHASFARVDPGRGRPVWHGADLLPVAFTPGSLAVMVANVQRVQERLGRPLLVENLSASLAWADDTMAEPDFLAELARRSGCGLLLDVNNLVVNALNAQPAGTPAAAADAEASRRACDEPADGQRGDPPRAAAPAAADGRAAPARCARCGRLAAAAGARERRTRAARPCRQCGRACRAGFGGALPDGADAARPGRFRAGRGAPLARGAAVLR